MRNHHPAASRTKFHQSWRAALGALPLILALPIAAQAATFTVTNTNDDGAGSLRDAIAQANTAVGADTIVFDSTVFADPANAAISVTSGELTLTDDVTIDGSGFDDRIHVAGDNSSRIFNITGAAATINQLFIFRGTAVNGGCVNVAAGAGLLGNGLFVGGCTATGSGPGNGGGALFNAGTVEVSNFAAFTSTATNGPGNGGGILNAPTGTLTMVGGSVDNNSANRAGGGIENNGGTVTLTDVFVRDNTVGTAPGNGGGMHQGGGSVTINGGGFTNNTAGREGGGLWAAGTSLIQPDADGNGTVFESNSGDGTGATNGGGGLFNQGGTMTVMGAEIRFNIATQGSGSGGGILNNVVDGAAILTVSDTSFAVNDANRAGGAIEDNGGTVTLTNVTMIDNAAGVFGTDATPGNGGGLHSGGGTVTISGGEYTANQAAREGGAIWTSGPATFTDVTVTDNLAFGDAADNGGGGLFNEGGSMTVQGSSSIEFNAASGLAGSGGGIFNNGGMLNVSGASISSNSAMRAGGGIEDVSGTSVTLTDVTMNDNIATGGIDGAETADDGAPGNGGAVHISGTGNMTVSGSMFAGNFAAAEGGGLWNSGGDSKLTISGSTLDGNVAAGDAADQGGGGLFNNGGVLTVNAILELVLGSPVMTTPTRVINNEALGAAGSGGGILNDGGTLIVSDTEFSNNSAERAGGGIEDDATGGNATTTTLTRVTLDSNSTGASPGNGGATHVTGPGTITIDSSTVSNNTADNEGGGLWNHSTSTMNVLNSTVAANSAPEGGGIYSQDNSASTVNITNSTIARNTNRGIETGGTVGNTVVNLTNSIVADNTGGDISATVNANFSLIESTAGATINGGNNVTGSDPLLGMLTDNGGPTLTLLTTSGPAIDSASNGSCLSADQRGTGRPLDGNGDGTADCDMGAVEFADGPVATVSVLANNGPDIVASIGDQNVQATSISYQNDSDESITVSSIAGRVNGGRLSNVSEVSVLVDGLKVPATVSFSRATGNLTANIPGGETVQVNGDSTITVALSFKSSTATAGFGLLGLLLLGITLMSRRSRVFAAMLVAGSMSIACSGSNSSFSDSEDDQTYSVTVTRITAIGDNTNAGVATPALPVTGDEVRLEF